MQNKLINIINVLVSNKIKVIDQKLVFNKIEPIIKQHYDEGNGTHYNQILINIKCFIHDVKGNKIGERELEFECNEFDLLYSNAQNYDNVSLLCQKADLIDNIVNQICIMIIGYEW